MTLRFLNGCVIASYRGATCAALAWDGLRAVRVVLDANAAPVGAAAQALAGVKQQEFITQP